MLTKRDPRKVDFDYYFHWMVFNRALTIVACDILPFVACLQPESVPLALCLLDSSSQYSQHICWPRDNVLWCRHSLLICITAWATHSTLHQSNNFIQYISANASTFLSALYLQRSYDDIMAWRLFSMLLVLCEGNPPMTSEAWTKWPMFYSKMRPGAHFTNNFFIMNQIPWKLHSALIQVIVKWSL